jgi:hypothetical protein
VQVLVQGNLVGSVTTPGGDIEPYPNMIRMPIGAANAGGNVFAGEDITIRISVRGNGGAGCNVHSVSLGYEERQHAPSIGVSS